MRKALFIDRDGTILVEPSDEQIDSFLKFRFVPGAISALRFLRQHTDYEFVMVSNQDGLGTESYPESDFLPTHQLMLDILHGEGVDFDAIHIDRSFPTDNLPTRKPGTGMLTAYLQGDYDLARSWVIGDRDTDLMLARNLGAQGVKLSETCSWDKVCQMVFAGERTATVKRTTRETDIEVRLNLDGNGESDIHTGLGFLDHMLEQLPHHGMMDLYVRCQGDLNVDEHHTVEDTALALGQCLRQALGDKRGEKWRVFKRAPIHDAFRIKPGQLPADFKILLNWPKGCWLESKITVRFWIITIITAALTIVTLKIR